MNEHIYSPNPAFHRPPARNAHKAFLNIIIDAWREGNELPRHIVIAAAQYGLPASRPRDVQDVARHLYIAGAAIQDIVYAWPENMTVPEIEAWIGDLPPELPSAIQLHADGYPVQDIASLVNRQRSWVYYWLGRLGLEPNISRRHELTNRQAKQVRKMSAEGKSIQEIADHLDVGYYQVRRVLREAVE